MKYSEIKTTPIDPHRCFESNGVKQKFSITNFWSWNQSSLIENRNRGILAEFIVKTALGLKSDTRLEWDAYDLKTEDGYKIEIKSAAYIQAWEQDKLSNITFDIAPKKTLLKDNNYSKEKKRHAHIYVFCLLHEKDQGKIDPMKLDQWTFYICPTINLPKQDSAALSTIKKIHGIVECSFPELADHIEKIKTVPNIK